MGPAKLEREGAAVVVQGECIGSKVLASALGSGVETSSAGGVPDPRSIVVACVEQSAQGEQQTGGIFSDQCAGVSAQRPAVLGTDQAQC